MTPYWAGDRDGVLDRLGPVRNEWQYPYASLAKTGATLAFCSDWPGIPLLSTWRAGVRTYAAAKNTSQL